MDSPPLDYQTFVDQDGTSPSIEKLELLKIPENLNDKYVLDLGCNEGFFSFECEKRGGFVTALEHNKYWIGKAVTRKYLLRSQVDFKHVDWFEFLTTTRMQFDLVLFTAAFHYINGRQQEILNLIYNHLNNDGLLILEVGLAEKEPLKIRRESDNAYCEYPTSDQLMKFLEESEFQSIQYIGEGVNMQGDPIQRHIYHVRK